MMLPFEEHLQLQLHHFIYFKVENGVRTLHVFFVNV